MTIMISDILNQECTQTNVAVSSKKKLFQHLASVAATQLSNANSDDIYQSLLTRERLGSTGFGGGIAIPHCRLMNCQEAFGILLRLAEPIDFDAVDRQPVDIVFALFVPEAANNEHLQVLATLAERFNKEDYRQALRNASGHDAFFSMATAA